MKMRSRFIFSFLLVGTLSLCPLLKVAAAGKDSITKVKEFVTYKDSGYEDQVEFANEISQDGKTYILNDVRYEAVKTDYLDKKEKVLKSEAVPEKSIMDNGEKYTLLNTNKEEQVKTARAEQVVTAYDDYSYAIPTWDIPATKTVTTDGNQNVVCDFVGIVPLGTSTIENVMTITFENYDAAYYEWNGNLIPKNDQAPALNGYENQLLASVGAEEGSAITSLYWAGEPYEVSGVLRRDAAASVQQTTQTYRANYRGTVVTEEEKVTFYESTYTAPDKEGRAQYTIKATGVYSLQESNKILSYMLTGVGVLLIVCIFIIILMILVKREKEKDNAKS